MGGQRDIERYQQESCQRLQLKFGDEALSRNSLYLLFSTVAPLRPSEKSIYFDDGKPVWQTGEQQLPLGAVIGGITNEPQHVIRARHNGSLTPGKFVPSEGLGYIPWGGNAHAKENFEVLCGYNFKWVKSSKDIIPIGAMPGGYAEETREPLYVGRAEHEGCLIPGKVQPSHSVCYIAYDGKEIAKPHYEILVHLEDPRRMRYALPPDECSEQYIYDDDNDSDEYEIRRQRVIILNH
ncbi:hypothetical protein EVAR_25887_1 [Eumeta japonica]|uniref:Natterin-3 n=1 Tax=Eumeta variegata TaxID=151549 RepID=A0A4C1W3R1_EUMVA|nr:hypothetical protein EVAR_25887_1 [Eumeta japonica]